MVRLQDLKLARHQHLDAERVTEESSGVKRRGRPFNHTPECLERQAVFRASNFERHLLVKLLLRRSLSLVLFFLGRA